MTKILLVRHGHVEGISSARFRGRADLPLTARGVAEAGALARRIAQAWRPVTIYTSPMSRCVDTGRAIAEACRISSGIMEDLNDLDYGDWQMRTHTEMKDADPVRYAGWFTTPHLIRFPNGESLQDLVARAADALRLTMERHPEDTVVLVGHESVNRAMLTQVLDQPLSSYWRLAQNPCCLNEIDIGPEQTVVCQINVTAHLAGI